MTVKELSTELGKSRATIYRRAKQAGIEIDRDEHGALSPDTISALGNLFNKHSIASAADTNTDTDSATGNSSTGQDGISAAGEGAANTDSSTGNTDSGETSSGSISDTDTSSATLDRLRELENECSRLTIERDAARREADIWREQAQQWREQATRSDARIDRLLNAGTNSENESPTFAERLRRLFSRSGK